MNPADFPETNIRLTPPEDAPACEVLKALAFDADRENGTPPGYLSRWHPTAAEKDAIAAGGSVWVFVYTSGGPPPIGVMGLDPFQEHPPRDAREIFADAFSLYEAETGRPVLQDWQAWEGWALAHPQVFAGLSAEELPRHLAAMRKGGFTERTGPSVIGPAHFDDEGN
jgi:hypothetical protein